MLATVAGRMPPELWIKVIRAATYLPEAFDTTSHDALPPGGAPALHSQEVFAMMRNCLATKVAISLVCRTWNSICFEYLFEFIIVSKAIDLPFLADLLSRPLLGVSKQVRRLDFVYVVPDGITRCGGRLYTDKQLVHAAARLVRRCSHLQVFSSRTTGNYGEMGAWKVGIYSLARALMRVGGTLESLEWHPHLLADATLLSKLNRRCSRLRLLLFPEPQSSPPYFQNHPLLAYFARVTEGSDDSSDDSSDEESNCVPNRHEGPLKFSSLHTLVCHPEGVWRFALHGIPKGVSSLRHIIVSNTRPEILQCLLQLNPQIDTITFRRDAFRKINDDGLYLTLPKTVHTLVFYLQELPMTPLMFPYVERIGLKSTEILTPELYDYTFNFFIDGNADGGDSFPRLSLIRFMDAPLARNLEMRQSQFKLWERRCRSKGVRLEDERGQLMILGSL